MKDDELNRKVRNLEILAARSPLDAEERIALRDQVQELLTALQPRGAMKRWGIGGAAAGAVLPVIGVISGGIAGAAYAAYSTQRPEVADARKRLEVLRSQLA